MKHLKLFEVKKGKSHATVTYKRKGRDQVPFKSERGRFFVYDESKNEVRIYSRFTGTRIRNYSDPEAPYIWKPKTKRDTPKAKTEKELFLSQVSEKDIISINFMNKMKSCELAEDYPELMEASALEYKKRFS